MQVKRLAAAAALMAMALPIAAAGARAAETQYPLSLNLTAKVKSGDTEITSIVRVAVNRLMEESRRTRVIDAFTHGGYSGFLNTLRTLPPIGKIEVQKRSVDIRYAVEQPDGSDKRLTLVADRPLVFLNAERQRDTTGYELTVVELRLDAAGNATGTMAGAARVKPSPDGVVLYDYNEAPIQLEFKKAR
jgi:hypothetical protein